MRFPFSPSRFPLLLLLAALLAPFPAAEGAEREALRGAAQTIARWQPRLNVACYHRNEDLFGLPLLVHTLNPAYRLYLRHHPYVPAWDVNLYAR